MREGFPTLTAPEGLLFGMTSVMYSVARQIRERLPTYVTVVSLLRFWNGLGPTEGGAFKKGLPTLTAFIVFLS